MQQPRQVMADESTVTGTSELDEDVARDYDSQESSVPLSLYLRLQLLMYVAPSLLCLISVVGVVGNSFVIYVITSTPHMRSSATNILLLNLAVADLFFLVVCAPFMAHKYATFNWTFGDVACKLVGFASYTSSYVTVYTLVAISALRYGIRYTRRTGSTCVCRPAVLKIFTILTTKRSKAQRVARLACANATMHFLLTYRLAMLLPPSE